MVLGEHNLEKKSRYSPLTHKHSSYHPYPPQASLPHHHILRISLSKHRNLGTDRGGLGGNPRPHEIFHLQGGLGVQGCACLCYYYIFSNQNSFVLFSFHILLNIFIKVRYFAKL